MAKRFFNFIELIKTHIDDLFFSKKLSKVVVFTDKKIDTSNIAEICLNATITRHDSSITEDGIYIGKIDNIIRYLNEESLTIIVRPSNQEGQFDRICFSIDDRYRKGSITDAFMRYFGLESGITSSELVKECLGKKFYFEVKSYTLNGQKQLALTNFWSASEIDCMMDIADDGYEGSFAILENYDVNDENDDF